MPNKLFLQSPSLIMLNSFIRIIVISMKFMYFFPFFSLQVNLRLIMVSGKTREFLFSASNSAGEIAQYIFDNWPEGEQMNHLLYLSTTDISGFYLYLVENSHALVGVSRN